MVSLDLLYLSLTQLFRSMGLHYLTNLWNFQPLFLLIYIFFVLLSLSSISGTLTMWTLVLLSFSHSSLSPCIPFLHLFSLFSLCGRDLMNYLQVHWFCSLTSPLRYQAHPVSFEVSLLYVFQVSNFHLILFYNFYLFAEVFYFSFVSREFFITSWSIFMKCALKSLPVYFNLWFILTLASIDGLFSFRLLLSGFLAWRVIFHYVLDILDIVLWESGLFLFIFFNRQTTCWDLMESPKVRRWGRCFTPCWVLLMRVMEE